MKCQKLLCWMTLTDTLYMRSELKWYYSCQAFWCLWCFVSCELGVALCGDTIALAHRPFRQPHKKKKHHGWHIFDTVHLFCLWAMHFKEGQDVVVAKCVPNKWYPGQNGRSSESVLAKGSKSMWLRQHPSSLRAVTLSGGTNGLSWLGSSEGLWPRASSHLGELAAPLGPPSEKR